MSQSGLDCSGGPFGERGPGAPGGRRTAADRRSFDCLLRLPGERHRHPGAGSAAFSITLRGQSDRAVRAGGTSATVQPVQDSLVRWVTLRNSPLP